MEVTRASLGSASTAQCGVTIPSKKLPWLDMHSGCSGFLGIIGPASETVLNWGKGPAITVWKNGVQYAVEKRRLLCLDRDWEQRIRAGHCYNVRLNGAKYGVGQVYSLRREEEDGTNKSDVHWRRSRSRSRRVPQIYSLDVPWADGNGNEKARVVGHYNLAQVASNRLRYNRGWLSLILKTVQGPMAVPLHRLDNFTGIDKLPTYPVSLFSYNQRNDGDEQLGLRWGWTSISRR